MPWHVIGSAMRHERNAEVSEPPLRVHTAAHLSTDRRRAMSTLSAWAFGSVACSAAAKADQGGTLDSFSQSIARVGSTLGQQDSSAAGDASGSAAPNAGESPRSFKAEASSGGTAPAAENSEPAACVFDPVDLFNVDYAAASYRDHNDRC